MALRKIKVMLSSRCDDRFPSAGGPKLSETRRALKGTIEAETLWGEPIFDVWINETAPPAEGDLDSWDTCLKQVRECDVLIVLGNGNAGWSSRPGDIGICHAEMMTGLNSEPAKVRYVSLGDIALDTSAQGQRNKLFQDYVKAQTRFRGASVTTVDELIGCVRDALLAAVTDLAALGVREARRGRFYTGEALAWSRLGFAERQSRIRETLAEGFVADGARGVSSTQLELTLSGGTVLMVLHAIPGALSVSAAREMVGRPFLRDHELAPLLTSADGPIHIIGCHQGATETQARQLLGVPDATFVQAPFGVYVADPVQNLQFVFLQNCRDETMTRHAVQRLLEWLSQSGQGSVLAERAASRRRIVQTIAEEASRLSSAKI